MPEGYNYKENQSPSCIYLGGEKPFAKVKEMRKKPCSFYIESPEYKGNPVMNANNHAL